MRASAAAVALAALLALPAAALELPMPRGAVQTDERSAPASTLEIAAGPWSAGVIPALTAEGDVLHRAWRIAPASRTSLQLLEPLREALREDGYVIVYECSDAACGGFDFRFGIETLPAPGMMVNLGDYRYLSARNPETGGHVAVLVSRLPDSAYLQVSQILPEGQTAQIVAQAVAQAMPAGPLAETLQRQGHAVLEDLAFASGSSALEDRSYASLAELASYLRSNPDQPIALVGHTDSVGSLDANIALSRKRAQSVRTRLLELSGAAPGQIAAEGMGYLAPRDSNLTPEGRERNRRVEAILLTPR